MEVLSESTVAVGDSRTRLNTRHKLAFLDLVNLTVRQNFSERCEYMGSIRIGATAGGIRCAFKEDVWIAGFASELEWQWFGDLSAYNGLQTGAISDDVIFLIDTGFRTSWARGYASFGEAKWGGNPSLFDELLIGPTDPFVRVSRAEVGWRSQLTIGIDDGDVMGFMSPYVELPVWSGFETYDCVGCTAEVSDFKQGIKVGIVFGIGIR